MNYVLVVQESLKEINMNKKRILVVNDDGYDAIGIQILARHLTKYGDVVVYAPADHQSAQSQAITVFQPLKREEVFNLGYKCYKIDGKPADCVRFAITGLHREYDIVFSGINKGYNIGDDIAYSGTIGAIFEASRLGHKAIAFSTGFDTFDYAMDEIDATYSFIMEHRLLEKAGLLNVNFPLSKSRGIAITRQGGMFFSDEFVDCGNDMYKQEGREIQFDGSDLDVDINAVRSGYISITPLTAVRTDFETYYRLKAREISK
jgi:5'-nucleotidase